MFRMNMQQKVLVRKLLINVWLQFESSLCASVLFPIATFSCLRRISTPPPPAPPQSLVRSVTRWEKSGPWAGLGVRDRELNFSPKTANGKVALLPQSCLLARWRHPAPHWCLTNNQPEPGRWPVASIWFGRNFCSSIELCCCVRDCRSKRHSPGRSPRTLPHSPPDARSLNPRRNTEAPLLLLLLFPPSQSCPPLKPTIVSCPSKAHQKIVTNPGGDDTVFSGVCVLPLHRVYHSPSAAVVHEFNKL